MRRSTRVTLLALGAVSCLVSAVGIFAPLTDTVQTGDNSLETDALAAASDLKIADAAAPAGVFACGPFSDGPAVSNLLIGYIDPGNTYSRPYCIRNDGSLPVTLSLAVTNLTDIDLDCTGDEAAVDVTCGANAIGELSPNLVASLYRNPCVGGGSLLGYSQPLASYVAPGAVSMGSLAPGEVACFTSEVSYPGVAVQEAQSDRVTWRYTWTGQA